MACTYPCLMDAGSVFIYSDEIFYHYRIRKDAMTKQDAGAAAEKYGILYRYLEKIFPGEKMPKIAEQLNYHRAYLVSVVLLEEILKHDRIGSFQKGKELARECFSNEAIQYLMNGIRLEQLQLPVSHRQVLNAYRKKKALSLLFWTQIGYLSQWLLWKLERK